MQAVYVGMISAFMKVVHLTLAKEMEYQRVFFESSEHGSTKFCTFCPSTTSDYSKILLMGSDFNENFAPKSGHGYVKPLWASRGFIR